MIEAVLLTGGASRRMGIDKARLTIDGLSLGERTARELEKVCDKVTVLGKEPLAGRPFIKDSAEHAGPAAALAAFHPEQDLVFVVSCDLPHFRSDLIEALASVIGDHPAAVPLVDGRLQPLSALFRRSAFADLREIARECEHPSMMSWLKKMNINEVTSEALVELGADPHSMRGVNTPEELRDLLSEGSGS
jgi:molybdopterin-guanine dinucleotide biosynthesis protein A